MGPIFLLLTVLLSTKCIIAEEPDANLRVVHASRVVDLTSPVVRQTVTLTFENSGSSPVSSFIYVVDPNIAANLAFIDAKVCDFVVYCRLIVLYVYLNNVIYCTCIPFLIVLID